MTLITNIGELVGIVPEGVLRKQGAEMADAGILRDAWLAIEDGRIAGFGGMADLVGHDDTVIPGHDNPVIPGSDRESIDARGGMVLPAFCDSHTHIVFAGSREQEFEDKIRGLSYAEIAARGGGILNSAQLLHDTPEDELFRQSMVRVKEMMAMGTGAIEIKSGYGLCTADELKMLRVIRRISEEVPAVIRATFLGAHAVPAGIDKDSYVRKVCEEMIPAVAAEKLAEYVDVFCEEGFFSPEETARILEAGAKYGLGVKLHANQLHVSGGVQVGVAHNALSVDHLERTTDAEIACLKGTGTMPAMLPGASFFLREPYGNARGFIDAGLGIALASDYNPGSSPSGDMRFVMALGCIQMRLTPEEALNAVTLNSAYALGVSDITGSITPGKRADIILTEPGWTLTKLPYLYQTPFIRSVYLGGSEQV